MNIKLGKHIAHPPKGNTTLGSKLGDLSVELGGSHAARAKSLVLDTRKSPGRGVSTSETSPYKRL